MTITQVTYVWHLNEVNSSSRERFYSAERKLMALRLLGLVLDVCGTAIDRRDTLVLDSVHGEGTVVTLPYSSCCFIRWRSA